MNQSFREYYSRIKEITDNTSNTLHCLLELPDKQIASLQKELEDITIDSATLTTKLKSIHARLSHIEKGIWYTYLIINNAKQSICTLKLLATNIQLEPGTGSVYPELIKSLIDLSFYFCEFEKIMTSVERRISSSLELVTQIVEIQFPRSIDEIRLLYSLIEMLETKKSECIKHKSYLDKLNTEKSLSSSEIITNLQFQDIIRQKIEHVQNAHEAILKKLGETSTVGKGTVKKPGIDIDLLFQIRDIGMLQAAQLMHANQEYQKAVGNITQKFKDLDNILGETIALRIKLSTNKALWQEETFNEFRRELNHMENEFETLANLNEQLDHSLIELDRKQQELTDARKNIIEAIGKLEHISHSLEQNTGSDITGITILDAKAQLGIHIREFRKKTSELEKLLDSEFSVLEKLQEHETGKYFKIYSGFSKSYDLAIEHGKSILKSLNATDNPLQYKVDVHSVANSVFKLEKVKYYKVFEQEVEEMIVQLNSLIELIDFSNIEKQYDNSEMDRLKKLYTMKSERIIHEMVTGKKTAGKDKEDEIEFFN
jgi:hypothetical protein